MDAIQVVWSPLLPGPRQVWHLQETRHTRPRCKCLRLRMLPPSGKVETVHVDALLAGKMKDTQVCQCQWSLNNLVLIQTLWTKIVPNFYPQVQCIWRSRWFFKVASSQSCTRIMNRRTKTYIYTHTQTRRGMKFEAMPNQLIRTAIHRFVIEDVLNMYILLLGYKHANRWWFWGISTEYCIVMVTPFFPRYGYRYVCNLCTWDQENFLEICEFWIVHLRLKNWTRDGLMLSMNHSCTPNSSNRIMQMQLLISVKQVDNWTSIPTSAANRQK